MGARFSGPHIERSDRSQSPTDGLLRLGLRAFRFFELRQLVDKLFRGLLEGGRAVRAAEVNLLAFVVNRVLRNDRLAAHRALRLTCEAFVETRFGKQQFSLFFVAGFLVLAFALSA